MATAEDKSSGGEGAGGAGGAGGTGRSSSAPATLLDTVTATVAATLAAHPGAARVAQSRQQPDPHAERQAEPQAHLQQDMQDGAQDAVQPDAAVVAAVSVIVSSGGDPVQLDRCLDALSRQDLRAPYEIIVVDIDGDAPDPAPLRAAPAPSNPGHAAFSSSASASGADAGIVRMVASWRARSAGRGLQLRYLPAHGAAGGAAARNRAWRAAGAPIVAFTTDDTVAAADWLREGLAAFKDSGADSGTDGGGASPADAAGGAAVDAVFGRVRAILPKHPSEFQVKVHMREAADFIPCNWFCRRSVLDRMGGFDERFDSDGDQDGAGRGDGDDMYFCLLESGAHLHRAAGATVVHPVPAANWGASLSQLRGLSGEALLYKKHPQLYREKIRRPPDWHDVVVVTALALAVFAFASGHELLAVATGGTWLVLTAMLCIRRLRDTAKTASQVLEVLITSPLLPPLALFWRLVGAIRYRVRFA